MAYVPGYEHDLFISYALVDDGTASGVKTGWVTAFVNSLEVELTKHIGRAGRLDPWWDRTDLTRNQPLDEQIQTAIGSTACLIVILTPGLLESPWCPQELDAFRRAVQNHPRGNSRIFVVDQGRLSDQVRIQMFPNYQRFEFFYLDQLRKPRLLGFPQPNLSEPAYYNAINDLAESIKKELDAIKTATWHLPTTEIKPFPGTHVPVDQVTKSRTVYLAETSDDLTNERRQVLKSLEDNQFRVLCSGRGAWDYRGREHRSLSTQLHRYRGHAGQVYSVSFSPDGQRIVSGSSDSSIKLWDGIWEREMLPTRATNRTVFRVSASASDRWIVTGDSGGVVEVWSAVSGKSELKLPAHTKPITALAMHLNATSVVSGSSDGTVHFHPLKDDADHLTKDAAPMGKVSLGNGQEAWSISYSKDGRSVAVGTNFGNVLLFDGNSGEKPTTFAAHTSFVKGLQFTDDGRFLVTAGWVKSATSGESDAAASAAESSAETKEVSEIKVWQLHASSEPTLTIPVNFAVSGFSLHGNRVAAGSKKGLVQIFNLETGKAMCEPRPAHNNFIHDVEFSPDGSLLASASDDTTIKIWECKVADDQSLSLFQTRTLVEHEAPVNSITFTHGDTRLVSGGNDGYLRVWLLKELLPLHDWNMKVEPSVVSRFPDAASGVSESAKLPIVMGTNNRSKQSVSAKPNPKPTDVTHEVLLAGFVAFITLITVNGRRKRLREKQNVVLSS